MQWFARPCASTSGRCHCERARAVSAAGSGAAGNVASGCPRSEMVYGHRACSEDCANNLWFKETFDAFVD